MFVSGIKLDGPLLRRLVGLRLHRADERQRRTRSTAGQPYNTCQLCNVAQCSLFVAHRTNPELQRLQLSRGDFVINGGLYAVYRYQYLDVRTTGDRRRRPLDTAPTATTTASSRATPGRSRPTPGSRSSGRSSASRRRSRCIWGADRQRRRTSTAVNNPRDDPPVRPRDADRVPRDRGQAPPPVRLRLGERRSVGEQRCNTARATVDRAPELNGGQRAHLDVRASTPTTASTSSSSATSSTRVEGAYYFRPSVDYDFLRHADGQKLGGGAAVIWSRASEFMQTPGHKRDLGVELDLQLYYQSKDGSLNDDPDKIGGFLRDAPVRRLLPARRASTTRPGSCGRESGVEPRHFGGADGPPVPRRRVLGGSRTRPLDRVACRVLDRLVRAHGLLQRVTRRATGATLASTRRHRRGPTTAGRAASTTRSTRGERHAPGATSIATTSVRRGKASCAGAAGQVPRQHRAQSGTSERLRLRRERRALATRG